MLDKLSTQIDQSPQIDQPRFGSTENPTGSRAAVIWGE